MACIFLLIPELDIDCCMLLHIVRHRKITLFYVEIFTLKIGRNLQKVIISHILCMCGLCNNLEDRPGAACFYRMQKMGKFHTVHCTENAGRGTRRGGLFQKRKAMTFEFRSFQYTAMTP